MSGYKKFFLSSFLLLIFAASGILISPKAVKADTDTGFPRPNAGITNWAFLSEYGSGHLLQTPTAAFRVYFDTSHPSFGTGSYSVSFTQRCRNGGGQPTGGISRNGTKIANWDYCNSFDQISTVTVAIGSANLQPGGTRYPGYKYVDLTAYITNGGPDSTLAVIATANRGFMDISFKEQPAGEAGTNHTNSDNYYGHGSGPQVGPYPTLEDNIALWAPAPPNSRPFELDFATDCSVGWATKTVFLRWYDADNGPTGWGGTQTRSYNINFDLIDETTGTTVISNFGAQSAGNQDRLGDNDSYRDTSFTMIANHNYRWVWSGVDHSNGIQVWIPFSEHNYHRNCSSPPQGSFTLNCPAKTYTVNGINDPDDGNAARPYRIVYGGDNTLNDYTGGGNTNALVGSHSVHGSESGSMVSVVNRTYWLQVQDDNGKWFNLQSRKLTSCGTPTSNATCTTYQHTMAANSYFRFTIFANNSGATINPPYVNGAANSDNHSHDAATSEYGTFSPASATIIHQSPLQRVDAASVYSYTYPAPTSSGWLVYIEHWQGDGPIGSFPWGNGTTYTYTSGADFTNNCYAGNCSISLNGVGPPGPVTVDAGASYNASATVNVTGTESLTSISWTGNANASGASSQNIDINTGDPPIDLDPDPIAPAALADYTLTATVYYGSYAVMSCSNTIRTLSSFEIKPIPSFSSFDDENPTAFTVNALASLQPGGPAGGVNANATSVFTVKRAGADIKTAALGTYAHTYGVNQGDSFPETPPGAAPNYDIEAGDRYCIDMTISPGTGKVDAAGNIYSPADSHPPAYCVPISNKPYLRGFGGGFAAGSCTVPAGPTNGILASWNNNSAGDVRGAGTQLSALALLNITGVATGVGNASAGDGRMLAFARGAGGPQPRASSPTIGGNFGSTNVCVTKIDVPAGAVDYGGGALASHDGAFTHGTPATPANFDFSGGNVPTSKNASIFVYGDVYINSDVTYNGGAWSLTGGNKPPSFVLHATGNIYIDPGVQELDGVYSADGKVYTCGVKNSSTSYSPMDGNLLYLNCNKQLTIYGSFTGTQVNLMRSYGSIRDWNKSGVGCSNGTNPTPGTPAGLFLSCGGEVFRFNPLIYLAEPAIKLPNNGAVHYDAITSLPPVL